MARGIALPTKAVAGRFQMLEGDNYIDQLVRTAMLPGDSTNPFQQMDPLEWAIFQINDELTEGEIRERATRRFESLISDRLARLDDLTFSSAGAEKKMFLSYINLETGLRREIEVPLSNV